MGTPLGFKYMLYAYMDPLGLCAGYPLIPEFCKAVRKESLSNEPYNPYKD